MTAPRTRFLQPLLLPLLQPLLLPLLQPLLLPLLQPLQPLILLHVVEFASLMIFLSINNQLLLQFNQPDGAKD